MSPAALEPVFPDLCLRDDVPPRLVQRTERPVDAREFRGTRRTQSGAGKSEWLPVIERHIAFFPMAFSPAREREREGGREGGFTHFAARIDGATIDHSLVRLAKLPFLSSISLIYGDAPLRMLASNGRAASLPLPQQPPPSGACEIKKPDADFCRDQQRWIQQRPLQHYGRT